jgi:hypothetical protein
MLLFESSQEFWRGFVASNRQNDIDMSIMVCWKTYCMGSEL